MGVRLQTQMNTQTTQPVLGRYHPYAASLAEKLTVVKYMLFLLKQKVELLKAKSARFNQVGAIELEKLAWSEDQIAIIETEGKIDILSRTVAEKENYYKAYMAQFEIDIADANKHFKHTLSIAQKSTKPAVQNLLGRVKDYSIFDNDDEARIAMYKQLKKYV